MLTTDASKDRTGFTLCTEPAGDLWRPGKCGLPDASHANCTKHNHCANHAHNAGHAHEAGHARHTGHAHDLGSLDPERVSSTWPGEAGPRHPRRQDTSFPMSDDWATKVHMQKPPGEEHGPQQDPFPARLPGSRAEE